MSKIEKGICRKRSNYNIFNNNCATISLEELNNPEIKTFICEDYARTRCYKISREKCLKLVNEGKIWYQTNYQGAKYINETGFRSAPANSGYGSYFKETKLSK